ncbi:MAG TPA: hypothetical protein VGJ10_08945 [Paraburkholderia sp.]|jgi:hypothetical protein
MKSSRLGCSETSIRHDEIKESTSGEANRSTGRQMWGRGNAVRGDAHADAVAKWRTSSHDLCVRSRRFAQLRKTCAASHRRIDRASTVSVEEFCIT